MNTKQAFNRLLESLKERPELFERLGVTKVYLRNIRARAKKGTITKEVMEKLLKKAGWKKTPEHWIL